jgi:hypothetical protein
MHCGWEECAKMNLGLNSQRKVCGDGDDVPFLDWLSNHVHLKAGDTQSIFLFL